MTRCAECLTELSSARLADIGPGSSVAVHCAICPDCRRVAEEVRYAEYRLAASLNEQPPATPPILVAQGALVGSERVRRRRIGGWIRGGLAFAGSILLAGAVEAALERRQPKTDITMETVELRCLSTEAATDLATPYLRSSGSAIYKADGAHAITVRGKTSEVVAALAQVQYFDEPATCALLPGPVSPPSNSSGIPGKD